MLAIAGRLISAYVLLQLCIGTQWRWTTMVMATDDHNIDNNLVSLDCTYDTARGVKQCDCGWHNKVNCLRMIHSFSTYFGFVIMFSSIIFFHFVLATLGQCQFEFVC